MTKPYIILGVVICTIILIMPVGSYAGKDTVKYRKHVVMDRQGLGIEAFRLLIPEGWHFQGGLNWLSNSLQLTQIAFKVSSPDNSAWFEVFPEMLFFYSTDPNANAFYGQTRPVHYPVNAVVYLEQLFLPGFRANMPGIHVTKRKQLPELAQNAMMNYRHQQTHNPYLAQLTMGTSFQFDAASVTMEYQQRNHTIEETICAVVGYTQAGMINNWGPMRQTSLCSLKEIKNKMSPILCIISNSFRVNPLWEYKISQLYYAMTQQQKQMLRSIGEVSRYISRTNDQISDSLYQSYKQRDAIYDRVSNNWSDAIRSVDTYQDPINGVEVEVPNTYEKAWTDGNEYIFTNDRFFDPNQNAGPNWTPLERRP
ncbi:MAG: hypothetical protein JRC55_05750 [Deltaproteobacteria bacterium]|nr:hypothetical protein [Deltaproteobacteria bacterium]